MAKQWDDRWCHQQGGSKRVVLSVVGLSEFLPVFSQPEPRFPSPSSAVTRNLGK